MEKSGCYYIAYFIVLFSFFVKNTLLIEMFDSLATLSSSSSLPQN